MVIENLYGSYSINFATLDVCPKQEHQHTFFELVYIRSGSGKQCINQSHFSYKAGHMFLLTPEDCHSFDIDTTTEFLFLQFNDIYLKTGGLGTDNIQRLEYILQNANHRPGCILRNMADKTFAAPLVEAIFRECSNRDVYNQELVHQLVNTLIIMVARNIAKSMPEQVKVDTDERAIDILQYIQHNIYYPDKLRTEHLSEVFNVSSAYLGRYFKKHAQETMQGYITHYKIKLIEHRLRFSDKRINEIAEEFGFTDISHLNKFFKKQKGNTLKTYREMVRVVT
jgi:AraC-like DNA-binding protein